MITELVTFMVAYMSWNYLKDLPFSYITQSEIPFCEFLNGSFCVRIAYFVAAIAVYLLFVALTGVSNVLKAPIASGLAGAGVGAGLSAASILLNLLFGFIQIKGIDTTQLYQIPIILVGMLMTGVTEELLYRALPYHALSSFVGPHTYAFLSSLFFGYMHSGYSLYYGVTAFMTGLLLAYGFLKKNIFWSIGLHSAFNTLESSFYTVANYSVKNKLMAGERKTPDDDGLTTSLITPILLALQYIDVI
jgi:membrane protease YdiL (CAAX protease family)